MELEYTQQEIDAFVMGNMSPSERDVFIQKMKQNPALADAVAETRFELDVADVLIRRDFRAKMKSWEEKKMPPLPPPSSPVLHIPKFRPWMLAAIAGLIAICFLLFKVLSPTPAIITPVINPAPDSLPAPSDKQIIPIDTITSQRNKPQPMAALTAREREGLQLLRALRGDDKGREIRGKIEFKTDTLSHADQLISTGDYRGAILLLEKVSPQNVRYGSAQLYLGDAYFFQKRFDKALNAYVQVQKLGGAYTSEVFWRLAAVYCAQGQPELLKKQLEIILGNPSHPDYKRASKLLRLARNQ